VFSRNVGEQGGVGGPLDEELEDDDERLLNKPIEPREDLREVDGEGDLVDVAGLLARCARPGMRFGRRATFRRVGVVLCIEDIIDVYGENGLEDRKG